MRVKRILTSYLITGISLISLGILSGCNRDVTCDGATMINYVYVNESTQSVSLGSNGVMIVAGSSYSEEVFQRHSCDQEIEDIVDKIFPPIQSGLLVFEGALCYSFSYENEEGPFFSMNYDLSRNGRYVSLTFTVTQEMFENAVTCE